MTLLLLTHPACLAHDPGPYHPERPDRLRAVLEALRGPDFAGVRWAEAPCAQPEELHRAHPAEYVAAVLAVRPAAGELTAIDGDTLMSAGSAEAASRAAGAAIAAVDAVLTGRAARAFCATRPPGHHAEPAQAMGFCFFANAVIAARHAQSAHGAARVAVLDFDVHHGNGTQACVEADASILFASTHQMPLYPGTGSPAERGVGNVFNVALRAGADGAAFRAAWDALLSAVDAFAPDLIVISAGFDAHARDPLANLRVHESDFAAVTGAIRAVAERRCNGRIVSVLEGGYDLDALAASAAAHVRALL